MRAEFDTKKSKLAGLKNQVENYEKGFLQETKSLDKDIMVIAEYSMRLLEKLDGYSIAEVIISFFYIFILFSIRSTKSHAKSEKIWFARFKLNSTSVMYYASGWNWRRLGKLQKNSLSKSLY